MTTVPLLPADEVALDGALLDRFLAVLGPDLILVGGQALAFWMERYGVPLPEGLITGDADALGNRYDAERLARDLGAQIKLPPQSARTAMAGQVRVPQPGGRWVNIDVIDKLYTVSGLRKSNEFTKQVIQRSVQVKLEDGSLIRVMDPFDLLESRVNNAVGLLKEKGPHVVTQAQWAIEVAKIALRRLAIDEARQDTKISRLGTALKTIYGLAQSSAGRRLLKDHGLDVLGAIEVGELKRLSPTHSQQLDRIVNSAHLNASTNADVGRTTKPSEATVESAARVKISQRP